MTFATLINEEDIIETDAQDKWDLIRRLVVFLKQREKINEQNFEEINEAILAREESMSTGIGDGVAIPHCSSPTINRPLIVMAVSRAGMDFEAIDEKPVHFIILLVVPKNKFQTHISTLAEIAKLMNNQEFRESLLHCSSTKEMYDLIQNREI